jgi:hypothetical protein
MHGEQTRERECECSRPDMSSCQERCFRGVSVEQIVRPVWRDGHLAPPLREP